MKLKNELVIALAKNGALALRANTVSAASAYRVIKFRRAIKEAFTKLQEAEMELIKECSLEISNEGKLNGSDENKDKFLKLRDDLYGDESEVGEIKSIPFTDWRELIVENKGMGIPVIEDSLEGIFWETPTEI